MAALFSHRDAAMNTARTGEMWAPLVPGVTSKLFPLVDRMYAHEQDLLARKIYAFKIDQEFVAALCEEESETIEQRDLEIFMAKFEMSHWTHQRDEFDRDLAERTKRKKESGNLWDIHSTAYLRRFHRLRVESPAEIQKMQGAFNLRVEDARSREVQMHSGDEHKRYDQQDVDAREMLVRHLLDTSRDTTGLELDKRLTRRSVLVYSRALVAQWSYFLAVDIAALRVPVEPHRPAQGGTSPSRRRIGPRLNSGFGVVKCNTRRALSSGNPEALVLRYEWFLPIRKAPLWSDYSMFYSLYELEAMLNMHLAFHSLITHQIEDAIRGSLS